MKNRKQLVLCLMMIGMIVIPMHTVRADFFSYKSAEDIMKNVVTGSLTAGIIMASYYYLQDYYEAQRNLKVTIVPTKEEKQDHQDSDSNMRIYYPGEIDTTFDDVAGLSGAKADMQDIISFLRYPEAFYDIGAKVPTGVLMCGLPGNGKTLLARAVAGMVNCPFISMSSAAFAEMYVGMGAYRVRELFKIAKKLAARYGACIIFMDEIDAIAQKRSGAGSSSGDRDYNQTIAQLLQCMDGLDKHDNPIIVLAATNRMDVLDPAVTRPGRFDRHVDVPKPEVNDRFTLLQNALNNVTHDVSINIDRLARITSGFSGAELANLINEAAILAVQAGRTYVDVYDIELAFDHVTLGREITGGERDDQDRWETAIHEAGHAIGYLFGNNKKYAIYKASIIPRSHSLGVIWTIEMHESHKLTEEDMRATIVMTLCGGYAEQIFGFGKSTGPSSDLAHAHRIAYDMVVRYGMSKQLNYISYDEIDYMLPNDIATRLHKEVEKIIKECCIQAEQLILSHQKEIMMIAQLLMDEGTVLGDDIYTLVGLPLPKIALRLA